MKKIKKIIMLILLLFLVSLIYVVINIKNHENDTVDKPVDYLIVLGAKIWKDQPSPDLQTRLDGAIKIYQKHKSKIIVSGGQGEDEDYPEALIMQKYLLKRGVEQSDILVEDKSTNTFENFKNVKKLFEDNKIDYKSKTLGFVTNNYHVYRSLMLAKRVFKTKQISALGVKPIGSSGFMREILAFYKSYLLDR